MVADPTEPGTSTEAGEVEDCGRSEDEEERNPSQLRVAEEVILLMHQNCRVSRNIRAQWLFEHLHKPIQLYTTVDDPNTDVLVYGIVPKDGNPDEVIDDESFVIAADSRLTFISRFYRQVYVLDLSPSTLVADEVAGCCLFTLLLDHLRACLISITRQVMMPGSSQPFNPQIYLTVLVFTPYLSFNEQSVLMQGVLLTANNVHDVYEEVQRRFSIFLRSLRAYSQPIIAEWGKKNLSKRRKYDSTSSVEMVRPIESTQYKKKKRRKKGRRLRYLKEDYEEVADVFSYRREQWEEEDEDTEDEEYGLAGGGVLSESESCIRAECSLIFMIRMGMLAIQLLPENTQSNIILVTDAVCGMPEASALHDLLIQLRSLSIACSFIQVQGRVRSEPSFGHIASCELFHFLAIATFGAYMPNCRCTLSELHCGDGRFNSYQRQLLCWWFQKALHDNIHIRNIVRDINNLFAELYTTDIRRHREALLTYECAVRDVVYIRMREGYTVKKVEEKGDLVEVVLVLPFRPLVSIEYTITSRAPLQHYRREKLKVEVELVAPYNVVQELIADSTTSSCSRRKAIIAYKDTIDGMMEADRILMHVHSFYAHPSFYTIPDGLSRCANGLFNDKNVPPPPLHLIGGPTVKPHFDNFWCHLINIEERIWQKWTHTHELRMLLETSSPKMRLFLSPSSSLHFFPAIKALHAYLASVSSFCLLFRRIYVKLLSEYRKNSGAPRYLYVIRVTGTPPLITLRVSFIGGLTTHRRISVMDELCGGLSELRLPPSSPSPALHVLRRPLERLLIKYHTPPDYLYSLVSLPSHLPLSTTTLTTYHALYKYLSSKRVIWKLPRVSNISTKLPTEFANFVMEMILRRRLLHGFRVSWMSNGIIGLCRQVDRGCTNGEKVNESTGAGLSYDPTKFALQQSILFPPIMAGRGRGESYRINDSEDEKQAEVILIDEVWDEPTVVPCVKDDPINNEALITVLFSFERLLSIVTGGTTWRRTLEATAAKTEQRERTETRWVAFSPGKVLRHAQRHLLLIPFHRHGRNENESEEDDVKRAEITLSLIHEQLELTATHAILQMADRHEWSTMAGDLEAQTPHFSPGESGGEVECKVYIRKVSPWALAGVAVPSEARKVTDWTEGAFPLLFFLLDGPTLAHSLVEEKPLPSVIHDRRKTRFPPPCPPMPIVGSDYEYASRRNRVEGGFSLFDLSTFISDIYEKYIVNALIHALFRSVNENVVVDARAVHDVTEEYCDFISLEVDGVDKALRTFCSHLQSGREEASLARGERNQGALGSDSGASFSSISCAGEAELELSFSAILNRFFKPIPSSPSYYHFVTSCIPEVVAATDAGAHDEYDEEYEDDENSSENSKIPALNGDDNRRENDDSEHPQRRKEMPLFLYFSCGLRFPTGEMETFPVSSLPSCIFQLIKRANLSISRPFQLSEVSVSLDLYVLTSPMPDLDDFSGGDGRSFAQAKRQAFLRHLPAPERAVVSRLLRSIGYLIEQEIVLMESRRKTNFSFETLSSISKFILRETQTSPKASQIGRIEEKTRNLALVIPSDSAMERLKSRLDGIEVEYCVLKRVGNLFYCCQVNDREKFASQFNKLEKRLSSLSLAADHKNEESKERARLTANSTKPLSTIDEREEEDVMSSLLRQRLLTSPLESHLDLTRKDVCCDFWVIITITDLVHVQFFQRYSNFRHYIVYEKAWAALKLLIRQVNQELLLEKAYESGECNSLLLITKSERVKYGSESEGSVVDGEEEDSSRGHVADSARFYYTPGTFACPMVAHHWFYVPSRLPPRPLGSRGQKNNVSKPRGTAHAAETLRGALSQFAVRNVENVYIMREGNGNVFYMYLHESMESLGKAVREIPRSIRRLGDAYFTSHLLLGIHGVGHPGEQVLDLLPGGLQKKLDQLFLDQLILAFSMNPKSTLTANDVQFIQKSSAAPSFRLRFTIPAEMTSLLSAFSFYLHQHLPLTWPAARYSRLLSDEAVRIHSGDSGEEETTSAKNGFHPFCHLGEPLPLNYKPSFYIIVRRPKEGKRNVGVACAEVRLATSDGRVPSKIPECRVNRASRSALLPEIECNEEVFRRLTATQASAPADSDAICMRGTSPIVYVDCLVWQVGDVGAEYVSEELSTMISRALSDVVTEFGMLNTPLFDSVPPASPLPKRNESRGSTTQSQSAPRWMLGRDSSSEAPPLSPHSLLPPLSHSKHDGVSFNFDASKRGSLWSSESPGREESTRNLSSSFPVLLEWFEFVSSLPECGRGSVVTSPRSLTRTRCKLKTSLAAQKTADVMTQSVRSDVTRGRLPDQLLLFERRPSLQRLSSCRMAISRPLLEDLGSEVDGSAPPPRPSACDFVLVSYSPDVWVEMHRFGFDAVGDSPETLQQLFQDGQKELFPPRLAPFVPRLRLLLMTLTGNTITLYMYNFEAGLAAELSTSLTRAANWHDAKTCLVREIGLHKMGITHLAPKEIYDEGSNSNPLLANLWRVADSLAESDFPVAEQPEKMAKECFLPLMRIYRNLEPAFMPLNLQECIWSDHLEQFAHLRSQLRMEVQPHLALSSLHSRLLAGDFNILVHEVNELVAVSRLVHFVQSPLLLFPKWRRSIAAIRMPQRRRIHPHHPSGGRRNNSTPPARHRSITLSASLTTASAVSPSLRLHPEDSDPCQLRVENILIREYVEYLSSIGMRLFTTFDDSRSRHPTSSSSCRSSKRHPEEWLCSPEEGGIILARISFAPPYFCVQFFVWNANKTMTSGGCRSEDAEERTQQRNLRNLEVAKSELVAACHVHSFTYDFHLRMLSKYLLGQDQVHFQTGYDTSAFLVDFLQYYGCRPPYARNCIYEERASFSLQHGVQPFKIWDHFLNKDKLYKWKVTKMKQSDEEGNQSADFMLVSSDPDTSSDREIVKLLLHAPSHLRVEKENVAAIKDSASLQLLIYVIMVAKNHKSPLTDENRKREDSRASDGEFKHVQPPPPLPSGTTLNDLEADIEHLVSMVNEGILPTLEGRRRRFSSGGHLTPVQMATPLKHTNDFSSEHGGGDSVGSFGSLLSSSAKQHSASGTELVEKTEEGEKGEEWTAAECTASGGSQLAIQQNAPRRHRKSDETDPVHPVNIPRERAIYIHFLSGRQRRLQKVVEDATANYRRQLQAAVSDAEWICRRDSLWEASLAMPSRAEQRGPHSFFKPTSFPADPWSCLRSAASDSHSSAQLDTLLSVVRVVRLSEREPRVVTLLRGLPSAFFARHLLFHYGVDRCRFFEYPHSTKKCLVITNPNNLDAALLLVATRETSPWLALLQKEYSEETPSLHSDNRTRFLQHAVDEAVEELISCLISFVWTNELAPPATGR